MNKKNKGTDCKSVQSGIHKIKISAVISFILTIICLIKYYLFNILQVFPIYCKENRMVSWIIIFPAILIGSCLSLYVLFKFKNQEKNKSYFFCVGLSLPMLILVLYFFIFK